MIATKFVIKNLKNWHYYNGNQKFKEDQPWVMKIQSAQPFDKYEEAEKELEKLKEGFYKIEKIYRVK